MFFGWYVVAGTFTAQLLVVGFFIYAVSLVIGPVRAEFGVSLEQVMYSMTIGTFTGLIVAPLCGNLLDRYSARWIVAAGILVFALGMWLTAQSTSISQYIWLFGLTYSVANGLAGSMAASTAVSRWFSKSRGKALGVAAIGTSAGGILVPILLSQWIDTSGWRGALENLSIFAIIIILPIVVLTIRGKPADMGLFAEGITRENAPSAAADTSLSVKDIVGRGAYWYIGLSLGILFCAFAAVLSNISPYAAELGYTAAESSRLIMVLAVASLVGKLIFGFLADFLDLKLGLWTAIGLVSAGLVILAALPGYSMLVVAFALLGLATGGMLPVWGAMMARAFGLASYGKAMGLMGPLMTLSVMPGFTIMGRTYDVSGSYQLGMLVFCGLTFVSAAMLLPLQLEKD